MKGFFLPLILLISLSALAGPQGDTIPPKAAETSKPFVSYITEKEILKGDSLIYHPLDTSLYRFHIYNPVHSELYPHRFLGNLASAAEPLVYPVSRTVSPFIGFYQLAPYERSFDNILYYKARKRFTEIFYVTGAKKEQILDLVHTQNVLPRLNFGINLRRMTILGKYARQYTYVNNLGFFGKYQTRNKRYSAWGNILVNRIDNEENGGLRSTSEADQGGNVLANNKAINLGGFTAAETRWKQKSFYLAQFINSGVDSISRPGKLKFRIGHSVFYETKGFVYSETDPDNGFYRNIYLDTNQSSLDTTGYSDLSNEFSLLAFSKNMNVRLYYKYQALEYTQGIYDTYLHAFSDTTWYNSYIGTELSGKLAGLKISGEARYGFKGYNRDDFSLNAKLEQLLGKAGSIGLAGFSGQISPPVIAQRYSGNHFRWDNSFVRTSSSGAGAFLNLASLKLYAEASYSVMSNVIAYDSNALPFQHKNVLHLFQARLNKDFRLGNWGLENRMIWQAVNADIVRIPDLITWQSLYYERKILRNKLLIRTGLDLRYISPYLGNDYMPATGQFYRQNERETEGYPVIDVFFAFNVKSARLFIKVEQVNGGFMPGTYYQVPRYPMPGTVLKFGLSWRFFD